MLKNYLKIALRNLSRNKGYTFINIVGLAIGMASALLMILWIQNELSFDQFHEKKSRIYEVWNRAEWSGKLECWNSTPKILAKTLEKDLPEIEKAIRVNWESNFLFTVGEKKMSIQGNIVDDGFLQAFSFPTIAGNPEIALKDVYNIVLTEKLAKKLFGNADPLGKTIKIDNSDNFTVSAVLKDLPNNTRFQFEYLLPWEYLKKKGWDDENWGNNSTRTYVLLKPNSTLESIAPKIKDFKGKYTQDNTRGEMFIYPISRWRLYSNFTNGVEDGGRITMVKLLAVIAAFILLIACINFMNLSTARSEKRAKEVGVRKVMGAHKGSLFSQFMAESILLAFFAGVFALILVAIFLPYFNELTEKQLVLSYSNPFHWLIFIGFIISTGVLAGSYPALFLSSLQPVSVLKGTFKKVHALITPRKALVVVQFTFAIILIISTIVVKQQINFGINRDSGYAKNNLIFHPLTGSLNKNYSLLKKELIAEGIATSVTKTSAPLTEGWSNTWGIEWKGKSPDDRTIVDRFCADEGLGATAGFTFIQGRDFDLTKYPTDSSAVLLNESAVKLMKFKEPIGQIIKDNGQDWHVVGVIKDFVLQSPYRPIVPMVIEGSKGWFDVLHVKFNENLSTAEGLKRAEAVFKKYNPEYPFEYKFIDNEYDKKFNDERKSGSLAALFAGLAIFISCLGLFGLATYMAENRIKEIGIRKVLGASIASLTLLLSKEFLKLVMISFVIGACVAWYSMNKLLQNYPYHIDLQWWVFAVTALLSIAIAFITVSYQAIKAALMNPVKSLKSE